MDCTNYVGLMAAMVATGSVVLVTLHAHRRLASDTLRKLEDEIGQQKITSVPLPTASAGRKKKVRFADEVVEPSSNNEEYRRRHFNIAM